MRLLALLTLLLALSGFARAQNVGEVQDYLERSQFGKYQSLVLGNPVRNLAQYADLPRKANLPRYVVRLAGVLVVLGFALSLWRGAVAGNEDMIKGAFMNMIVSGLFLALCFNYANSVKTPWSFSAVMFNGWGQSYNWSRRTFAPDMDQKIAEARSGMMELMAQVVGTAALVAVPEAAGAGLATTRSLAAATKGVTTEAAVAGGQAAARNRVASRMGGAVLDRFKITYTFLQYILLAYSGVVTITGLLVLGCIYVLPFGLAMINFGNTRILWGLFGTYFACWFSILLLPLFTAVAVNMSFVQPARAMEYYSQELALQRGQAQQESQDVGQAIDAQGQQLADECISQVQANPDNVDGSSCATLRSRGWFEKLLDGMSNVITQRLGVISDLINGLINTVAKTFWALAIAIANMAISIGILLGTPGRFAGLLGGVAENIKEGMRR